MISEKDTSILCDPWLVDGEFYGSWCIFPSLTIKPEDFDNVDAIYISHIHPDHFSVKTLKRMNKKRESKRLKKRSINNGKPDKEVM